MKPENAAYDIVHEDKVVTTLYNTQSVWDFYFAMYHAMKGVDVLWVIKGIGITGLDLQKGTEKKSWKTKQRARNKVEREKLLGEAQTEVKT